MREVVSKVGSGVGFGSPVGEAGGPGGSHRSERVPGGWAREDGGEGGGRGAEAGRSSAAKLLFKVSEGGDPKKIRVRGIPLDEGCKKHAPLKKIYKKIRTPGPQRLMASGLGWMAPPGGGTLAINRSPAATQGCRGGEGRGRGRRLPVTFTWQPCGEHPPSGSKISFKMKSDPSGVYSTYMSPFLALYFV